MFNLEDKNAKGKFYLLIFIAVLVVAILRILALGVHTDLPRLPSQQDGYYDYQGIIHWHTEYSRDSFGSYKDLAQLGNLLHLDFLISTEHNNLLALYNHQEGWHGHMLTLVGIESSRQEGYLLGINFDKYTTRYDSTDMFLSQVARQGGFTLIAHPKNPRWHWRGGIDERIVGQEILDLTDQFATATPLSILTGILYYPLNKTAAFMQVYHRPADALKMWDEITARRHFIGIYAPDVHQSIRLWGRHMVRFPKAEDMLPIAHDHVILGVPFSGDFKSDKTALLEALIKGRLYVAIDSLQDATGFFFSARQGDKIAWMGDQLPAGIKTDFFVKLPQRLALKNIVINVYHNGEKLESRLGTSYTFQETLGGSWRIEVECGIPTFWGLTRKVVWIYSNPIYLR